MRGCSHDGLGVGEGWLREEAFIGKDGSAGGVIDRDEAHLVDEVDLFHRFAKAQAEEAVAFAELIAVNFDPLVGVGDVVPGGRDPMADDGGTDDVGNEVVAVAVPRKQSWAGAAAAGELCDGMEAYGGDIDLVLRDAGGPEQADEVSFIGAAEAGKNLRLTCVFPLLPEAVGEYLNLRADAALVIRNAVEQKAQRVIAIAAVICEEDRGTVGFGDDQVGSACVIDVGCNERARRVEMDVVELELGTNVCEPLGAKGAQDA